MNLAHGIYKKENKVFTIKRNDKPLKGIYSLPGGKIQNESSKKALERELKEELGLKISLDEKDFIEQIDYRTKNLNFSVSYFKINFDENKIKPNKKEISEIKWMNTKEFCENLIKAGLNKKGVNKLSVLLNET